MVARTVTQYARAGVAALHIEDQVQTKRGYPRSFKKKFILLIQF